MRVLLLHIIVATTLLGFQIDAVAQDSTEVDLVVDKMRQYCRSCHAIGNLRFIHSDDNAAVWAYINSNRAPNSQRLWRESIAEVLNWPSDEPPPFDQLMDPGAGRDWMPKGAGRLDLSRDYYNGEQVRQIILRNLGSGL